MMRRLLAIAGLVTVCLGASTSSCEFGNGGSGVGPSFVTELSLRDANGALSDSFARGELIELRLTVRNRLSTAATVEFTSARQSDFVVIRQGSQVLVWKHSQGKVFAQVLTELEFAAGETKTFTATWDQVDSGGQPVDAGVYEARGVLIYDGFDADPLRSHEMGSTLERFTIR
jgi:hypothetical protein